MNKEIPNLLSIQKGNPLENKARNFKIFNKYYLYNIAKI